MDNKEMREKFEKWFGSQTNANNDTILAQMIYKGFQAGYQAAQSEVQGKLNELVNAALEVVAWDWSDNDSDCVRDMARLRKVAERIDAARAAQEKEND